MSRPRWDIEREISDKRRERWLYATEENRAKVDAEVDELLEEWATAEPEPTPA